MAQSLSSVEFGKLADGTPSRLHTLANANGMVAKVADYGVIITELHVPDKHGGTVDVALGFDSLQDYVTKNSPFFGCVVGRVCNRIANGRFTLDGKTYQLAINNGPNTLHGGVKGFDKAVWKSEPGVGASVRFRHTSLDGDENFPGTLEIELVVSLTDKNELALDYTATTDKPTPINLTNHSYFNLSGAGSGDIKDHILTLAASHYTPSNDLLIPTGEISPVSGTPCDFTKPAAIGARFSQLTKQPVGYDNNFVIDGGGHGLVFAARVLDPMSGRVMETHTTTPGIQLYTANFLDGGVHGKKSLPYRRHGGFCLETQDFPNAINQPNFPSTVLRPGAVYRQTTVYRFLNS